jgi:hypothetical protein
MKNERWGKEPKSKDRLSFKDGQLEELRRRWEALPDGVEREEVKAQLTEWSQFQPAQPHNK